MTNDFSTFEDRVRLATFCRQVMRAKETQDFASVNAVLSAVQMHESKFLLVAFLRAAFSIRGHVADWLTTLYKVEAELRSRGLESAHLLRGLYPPKEPS